jgi:hypothetical protein
MRRLPCSRWIANPSTDRGLPSVAFKSCFTSAFVCMMFFRIAIAEEVIRYA